MLDDKSQVVLEYIKKHFSKTDKHITTVDIHIDGLDINDINKCVDALYLNGYINLNDRYIHKIVEGIND